MAPSYVAGNLLGGSITSSSEDSDHPKANLVDGDFASVLRFTGGASSWIEFDLTEQKTLDAVMIGNHNFIEDSSFALTVKAGNSPSPSSVFSQPDWRAQDILAKGSSTSARYWRIEITDNQAVGGVSQIGEIVGGLRQVLPVGIRFGERPHVLQEALINRTNRLKRYAIEFGQLYHPSYTFRFAQTDLQDFRDWWDSIRGVLDPFVWIPDDNGLEVFFMSLETQGFLPTELAQQAVPSVLDYTVTLIEEGIGGEVQT